MTKTLRLIAVANLVFVIGCGNPFGSKKNKRSSPTPVSETSVDPNVGEGDQKDPKEECKEEATQSEYTYLDHVLPIVNKYCIGCH